MARKIGLSLPAKVVVLLMLGVALVGVGLGLGGVTGYRCVREERLEPVVGAREREQQGPTAGRGGCAVKKAVEIVPEYLSIDSLFLRSPHLDAGGGMAYERRVAMSRKGSFKYVAVEAVETGLDNVIFANSIGIKVAFLALCLSWGLSLVGLLAARNLMCYQQPDIVMVENGLLMMGAVLNGGGGALAFLWGLFAHMEAGTAGLDALHCRGWVVGGVLMVTAAALQATELLWTILCRLPPTIRTKGKKKKKKKGAQQRDKTEDSAYFTGEGIKYPGANASTSVVASVAGATVAPAAESVAASAPGSVASAAPQSVPG